MINELYELSNAMMQHGIHEKSYAMNYNDVSYKNCICITLSDGEVTEFFPISNSQKSVIRNYTETSSGGFPCMKLAPLYVTHDKNLMQLIAELKKSPEKIDSSAISKFFDVCTIQNNNWALNNDSINKKYKKSLALSEKIHKRLTQNWSEAFDILCQEVYRFSDPALLHAKLTEIGFRMLDSKNNVSTALNLLFNCIKDSKTQKVNCGEFSVLFNADRLYDLGCPVTSQKFTDELNTKLLSTEKINISGSKTDFFDAFQLPYTENNNPMPNVKIGAGFYVRIRIMNPNSYCLHRYGKKGSATFSASDEARERLKQALNYISKPENEGKTWICIDTLEKRPRDILFAYPIKAINSHPGFASAFRRSPTDSFSFAEKAKRLISEIKTLRDPLTDSAADGIRIFVLRRLDMKTNSGRTKVVYTRQTDPNELEKYSEEWTLGCTNLPSFPFGTPDVPYPLDTADTLNCFLKQDGSIATDKFKPFPKYHGIEILMEPTLSTTADLHRITECAMNIGAFSGTLCAKKDISHPVFEKVKGMLSLLGLFLYRDCIRKDRYMDNLPYLYGQLLKAADELHMLYCRVVRKGDIPSQLVGGSLFQNAAEMPVRTMNLLSQRIMPYYSWAKSYRLKNIKESQKESWRAGWLYSMCEKIMSKLQNSWTHQTRFNDEEKAQLFIGYLAEFPKKEVSETAIEEELENE